MIYCHVRKNHMIERPDVKFVKDDQPEGDACVELFNGRFIDVRNAKYFNDRVKVVIKGKRIVAMPGAAERSSDLQPDFYIDLKGRTVLPGLFNTHCHTTQTMPSLLPDILDVKLFQTHAEKQVEKNMAECLIHGITNIRDTWTADLRMSRAIRERIEKKEINGPRMMQAVAVGPPGGYLTEKHGMLVKWTRSIMGVPTLDYGLEHSGTVVFDINATGQQVRDAVDRAIDERGAEAIKIGEQKENMINFKPDATIMTLDQLTAIADQAGKRNLKSTIHHTSAASFRRAVKAGVSSLAHLPVDELLTGDDIALFLSRGCFLEPTLSVAYDSCYKIKGDPAYHDPSLALLTNFRNQVHDGLVAAFWIPEFRPAVRNYHEKASHEKLKFFGLLPVKKLFQKFAAYCTTGVRNLVTLFENGAGMATSNDGGVPPCTPAMVQHEIALLQLFLNEAAAKEVLNGANAVRMATLNAAKCLGLEEDFGTLETGKIADLVIVDGDPFKDPGVVGSAVAALFKDGKLVINNCNLEVLPAVLGKSGA